MIVSTFMSLGIALNSPPSNITQSYEVTSSVNTFTSTPYGGWWKENNFFLHPFMDEVNDIDFHIINELENLNVPPLNIAKKIKVKTKEISLPVPQPEFDEDIFMVDDEF